MKYGSVQEVLEKFGTQTECAKLFGLGQTAVSAWMVKGWMPLKRGIQLEQITKGKVKFDDIRHLCR